MPERVDYGLLSGFSCEHASLFNFTVRVAIQTYLPLAIYIDLSAACAATHWVKGPSLENPD